MSMTGLSGILMLVLIAVMAAFGTVSEKTNFEYDMKTQHIQAARVKAEPLKTNLTRMEVETHTAGKSHTPYLVWRFLETKDWVLLNGMETQDLCKPVLTPFMVLNAQQSPMTTVQIEALNIAYHDEDITLWAHVPRFTARPLGLSQCPGFGYDEARGLVTLGKRPVAILAAEQPNLSLPQ